MPFPVLFRSLLAVVILTMFLSGCLKSSLPKIGSQESRDEKLPAQGVAAQAKKQLLQDAKQAFIQTDYLETVFLLNRFVNNYPKSQLAPEAYWWLARSYQQTGNLKLALVYFERLAQLPGRHSYRDEARLRAHDLIKVLESDSRPSTIKGLSVKFQNLSTDAEDFSRIGQNRLKERSVILLDLGCPVQKQSSSILNQHKVASSNWLNAYGQDLETVLAQAFYAGQTVYLGVSLPCLGFFSKGAVEKIHQWGDWVFDPQLQDIRISPYFSLFSAGYQATVRNLLLELSQFKIAGIVFQESRPLGLHEGLTPLATTRFEEAFDVKLDPATLFLHSRSAQMSHRESDSSQKNSMPTYPDRFWKWAGWKSRERLRIINELRQSIQIRFPQLQFGLEVHLESLHAPVFALANFSEDWVETAHAPFDFFIVRFPNLLPPKNATTLEGQPVLHPLRFRHLIQRMVDDLQDPQKVWVEQQSRADSVLNNGEAEQKDWSEGVGEILDIPLIP